MNAFSFLIFFTISTAFAKFDACAPTEEKESRSFE